jgi:ATP-dependent DNA helicase RecG
VRTEWVRPDAEALDRVYERIREQAAADCGAAPGGRSTFVVCPLVEDSAKLQVASAVAEHERLSEVLSDLSVGLLHGQMRSDEKREVMAALRRGDLDVLVATTVIEVGIDVPCSTVMVIEDADRFGLSQLHQLRGRLSRGVGPNWCYLVAEPSTPDGEARLAAMVASDDGFRLAEQDLRIRGHGTVFGERQAGMGDLRLADILTDTETLVAARTAAFGLVTADPGLERHPGLREEVRVMLGDKVDWLLKS